MKDQRIIELVNGKLDGINTPQENTELTAILGSDENARVLLSEMETLDNVLASVPLVDPPPSLKAGIMESIARLESARKPVATESLLDRLLAPFLRRPALAVSYAFAVGLIVGLSVLSIVQVGPEADVVKGTIANMEVPVLAEADLTLGSSSANIMISRLGDEFRVDVALIAADNVNLTLNPEGQDPVMILSETGTQAYSILLPTSSSIVAMLSTGDASDETRIDLAQPHQ